jgi:hypothetical protein
VKTSEPKYIYRRLHECADGIAISESDLENVNNIDEFYENLMTEVMPVLLDQIGNLKTLREKLRHAEYGE